MKYRVDIELLIQQDGAFRPEPAPAEPESYVFDTLADAQAVYAAIDLTKLIADNAEVKSVVFGFEKTLSAADDDAGYYEVLSREILTSDAILA